MQTAFKESESVTDFEKRVNQIFEGDGIVLIKAEQTDTAFVLEGWENLDGNVRIDEGTDEKLFTITQKEDKSHEMRGHYANSYYHSTWGAGNFLFTYLLLSSFAGPRYVYVTPASRVSPIRTERSLYRNSSAYKSQVSRNGSYFNRQKGFAGSSYDSANRNRSTARQSYQSRARSTGAFRSSGTGVRSSWGASGRSGFSSGRSGGFLVVAADRISSAPPDGVVEGTCLTTRRSTQNRSTRIAFRGALHPHRSATRSLSYGSR